MIQAFIHLIGEIVVIQPFYSQCELGFEMVTVTQGVTANWSLGSAVNHKRVIADVFVKYGLKIYP